MSRSEATAWVDDHDLWSDPEDVAVAPSGAVHDASTGEVPAFFDQAVDLPSGALADDRDWGAEWVAAPPRRRRIASAETTRGTRPRRASELGRERSAVAERSPRADRGDRAAARPEPTEIPRPAPRPLELVEAPRVEPASDPAGEYAVPAYDAATMAPPPELTPEGRRVVQVTGRPHHAADARVARHRTDLDRRRPRRGAVDRAASRPDRIALYAVILGLFLVVLAATSSSAHAAGLRTARADVRAAHAHVVTVAVHGRGAASRLH